MGMVVLEDWNISFIQKLLRPSIFSPIKPPPDIMPPEHWPPSDPWKGDPLKGKPLAKNQHPRDIELTDIERSNTKNNTWQNFAWLRDMREYGGNDARMRARYFVLEWVEHNQRYSLYNWHPQRISTRIRNIILTWGWFADSATDEQQIHIIKNITMQVQVLKKDWSRLKGHLARIEALAALILTHAFIIKDVNPSPLAEKLIAESEQNIFEDGCHQTRQPDQHLLLLKLLIETKSSLNAFLRDNDDPDIQSDITAHLQKLEKIIMRMTTIVRMWRHANGRMLNILGSLEITTEQVNEILSRVPTKGKMSQHASDSGFMRMSSGRSTLMMTTPPAPHALPSIIAQQTRLDAITSSEADKTDTLGTANNIFTLSDAGTLAIEFSKGKNIIVVNVGQKKDIFETNYNLAQAFASTAAHSTLNIDQTNASDISSGGLNRRHATTINAEIGPAMGGLLAEACHDGYEKTHGLIHQRQIYLANGGDDLRGEDKIIYTGAPGHIPNFAVIRFHLHPQISASLSMGGDVLLKLPANANPWIFKAKGAEIKLEDGIMLNFDRTERTSQIVLTISLDNIRTIEEQKIRWAFRRQLEKKAPKSNSKLKK